MWVMLCDAAMAVLDSDVSDGKVYLITDGVDYTVSDLYRSISKGLGKKPLSVLCPYEYC